MPDAAPQDPTDLSLCMIVRDAAGTLNACLESVRPWVDEMIVVDTGSDDDSPQIAGSFGAKVFHFPWSNDFAAARNESLRHACGRWIFWMDADDTIDRDSGRKLCELACEDAADELLGYVMQVHCPGPDGQADADVTVVDHVKMFRNRPDLRFEGRIHEQILPSIRRGRGRGGMDRRLRGPLRLRPHVPKARPPSTGATCSSSNSIWPIGRTIRSSCSTLA